VRIADEDAEQAMLATVARVVRDVDERLPVLRVETWRDHLDAGLDVWFYRAGARVFSAFGGIALLLAVTGIYGVKSYVVSRRTREFGIRIAIGAHPRVLLWQVLREGGRITAVGIGMPAVGSGRRENPSGLPVWSERRRTGRAGDRAAHPARLVTPGVLHSGASRDESRSDSGLTLGVTPFAPLTATQAGVHNR